MQIAGALSYNGRMIDFCLYTGSTEEIQLIQKLHIPNLEEQQISVIAIEGQGEKKRIVGLLTEYESHRKSYYRKGYQILRKYLPKIEV